MTEILAVLHSMTKDAFGFFTQVYVFGSCLKVTHPNDVDILLVYQDAQPLPSKDGEGQDNQTTSIRPGRLRSGLYNSKFIRTFADKVLVRNFAREN